MKNIFIILLLLYPLNQVFSQIKTEGSLELGYEDRIIRTNDNQGNKYSSFWLRNKGFANINLNATYKRLSIYTGVKTSFTPETVYKYNPIQVGYLIGINYQIDKNKRFLFNAEHFCSHSIEGIYFYDAYDKISIKIKLF